MITLDTSGILAYMIEDDEHHRAATEVLDREQEPWLIPEGILSEVGFILDNRYGYRGLDLFFKDIEAGVYILESGAIDVPRVHALTERYRDLPLGYADAAVIACGERNGGQILCFDEHFSIVAREGTIVVVPDPYR